jgi:hypothetical protein
MSKSFTDISKEIANEFIQSIIFVDDKAYENEESNAHSFNAKAITHYFSKTEKICAVYQPQKEEDIEQIGKAARKADVAVLDWQINCSLNIEEVNGSDDEEDVEEEDERGIYTKKIIEDIIIEENGVLLGTKLIVIYTGETTLPAITEDIDTYLKKKNIQLKKDSTSSDNCCLIADNIRINVIAKSNDDDDDRFKHKQNLKSRIVNYEKLPEFILDEYVKITNGLLSNFALKSLSEIRKNSHQILSLFSNRLDEAYLSHQAMLPNTDNANELLIELIKDSFASVLRYHKINSLLDNTMIEKWIDHNITDKTKAVLKPDGTTSHSKYERNKDFVLKVLAQNENVQNKFTEAFGSGVSKANSKGYIGDNAITIFSDKDIGVNKKYIENFAKLTHHKSLLSPAHYIPNLTQGTIVYSVLGTYYVCIQQKCDSVRIKASTSRRFLFVSMEAINNGDKFNFITPDGVRLKLNKNTYDIRTVKFYGTEEGVVLSEKRKDGFYFIPAYHSPYKGEEFKWIFELKDLHSQRVVTNYCSELSRVGLDESEWLRLNQ